MGNKTKIMLILWIAILTFQSSLCQQALSNENIITDSKDIIGFKSYCNISEDGQFGSCRIKSGRYIVKMLGFKIGQYIYVLNEKNSKKLNGIYINPASGYAMYKDMFICAGCKSSPGDNIKVEYYYFLFRINENNVEFVDSIQAPDYANIEDLKSDYLNRLKRPKVNALYKSDNAILWLSTEGLTLDKKNNQQTIHRKFTFSKFLVKNIKMKVEWPFFSFNDNKTEIIRTKIINDLGAESIADVLSEEKMPIARVDLNGDGEKEYLGLLQDSHWFGKYKDTAFYIFTIKNNEIKNTINVAICNCWVNYKGDQEEIGIVNTGKKGWKDLFVNDQVYVESNGRYVRVTK